jgi:cytoskeletal protein CcmA (bactofilin family)
MNLNNLTGAFTPDGGSSASKNVLAGDVELKGTIKFETELSFDGKLEGEIISDGGILTLGKNADVRGDLKVKSVVVHGTVTGSISVAERCELKSTSQLTGDMKAMRVVIEEGAIFIGNAEVTPKSKADRAGTPAVQDLTRKIHSAPVTA